MGELDFCFVILDRPESRNAHVLEIVLNILSDFWTSVDGVILYREPGFPVVEFCIQINAWKSSGLSSGIPYISKLDSDTNDQHGRIIFNKVKPGWELSSIYSNMRTVLSETEVIRSIDRLVSSLAKEINCFYAVDMQGLLNGSLFRIEWTNDGIICFPR